MAEYSLGTARGVIEIEYKGDGAKRATEDLNRAGKTAEDSSKKMGKAGTQLAVAGAAITGGFVLAIKTAADFEQRMSAVSAVSGASAQELDTLRNKALQLGKDTAFSAGESALAIEELVKAGLSVAEVMDGAADATVNLAAAGEISLPEAATIASNAMNQFGLEAKELPRVADSLAGAANASAVDVRDLGQSLSQVGAVASLVGVDINDAATGLAALGNAGIRGSDAGTSLKTFFTRLATLTKGTDKQVTLARQLGLITKENGNEFFDASGKVKSLAEVSGILNKALGISARGMKELKEDTAKGIDPMKALEKQVAAVGKESQLSDLNELFGTDAIRAAAVLGTTGAAGIRELNAEMAKVTAAEVAEERMNNLAGAIEQLKGSWETLMIVAGTPFLHMIRQVVDVVTGMMNVFLELPTGVQQAIGIFVALTGVSLLLAGAVLKVMAALKAGGIASMLFAGPIGLIIVALAAAVAAFIYFYQNSEAFRTTVNNAAAAVRDGLKVALDFLVVAFQTAMPYVMQFVGVVQRMASVFMSQVWPVIMQIANVIGTTLYGVFQKVYPEILRLIDPIKGLVSALITLGAAVANQVQQYILPFLMISINFFRQMATVWTTLIVGTILPILFRLGATFTRIFGAVIGTALQTALAIIRNVLGIITGIIKVFTGVLTGDWSMAWNGVKQIVSGAVGAVVALVRGMISQIGNILSGVGSLFMDIIGSVPGLLMGLAGAFAGVGQALVQAIIDGIKGMAGAVGSAIKSIIPDNPLGFDVPGVPFFGDGGYVSSPTLAVVGDAGGEFMIPQGKLGELLRSVYKNGQVELARLEMNAGSRRKTPVPTQRGGGSRIVSGTLSIDRSGRAFLRGVAEDVFEGEDQFATTYGRMG